MKPIIRHCRNCEYSKGYMWHIVSCDVKYIEIPESKQRFKGLFCRFFKPKESD